MSSPGFHSHIRRRLFFSHLFAVALICGAFGSYFYWAASDALIGSVRAQLQSTGNALEAAIDDDLLEQAQGDARARLKARTLISRWVETLPQLEKLRIARRNDAGDYEVVLDSQGESDGVAATIASVVVKSGTGHGDPLASALPASDRLVAYVPVRAGEGQFLLSLQMRSREYAEALRTLRLSGALALLVALGLAIFVSGLLARHFVGAIGTLVDYCRKIAEGRSHEPLKLKTGDEFDQLAEAFNQMSERIEATAAERERALQALSRQADERARELDRLNSLLRQQVEERLRTEAMVAEAAVTDHLTGLLNRRGMMELLQGAVGRALGTDGRRFCLVIMDIDFFKKINDTYGHEVGDAVLTAIGRMFTGDRNDQDAAARWGGEEFLLLISDVGLQQAGSRAQRLRERIASQPLFERAPSVTASFGVAEYIPGESLATCIARADKALYKAKQEGRNLVVMAGNTSPATQG